MSGFMETLSPSKHIIEVSPFNDNIKKKGGMMMTMTEQEDKIEEKGSNNNANDEIVNNKVLVLKKTCSSKSLNSSSSSSCCSPKVSSPSLLQCVEDNKDNERCLQQWNDRNIGNLKKVSLQADNKVNQRPEVEIVSISIKCRDRPDIVLTEPFASSPKACLFTLKEGSRYRLRFSFIVSNKTVSGLKYTNTLWKAGVRVDRSEVRLGTFNPRKEPYAYELEEDTAPSGIFVRGLYCARTKVVDATGICYLDIKYYFEIQKSWPSSC
ncbi:OLC1v1018845C1 [Oldenlandia corymbosa var. corymbosa]|uniref:OLC1v1018845C1 n=1 Tax=Oldenlandia corymbosa var. corymbosa TaxID=529605 RepID=A0AAV1ECJ3_OLDCO|nr:OLC1v1018845C1 [Oldenlandia corymbosa var. corymbosa]